MGSKKMTKFQNIVVGQGPSKTTQDSPPFTGQSAKRLASLMGTTLEDFLAVFHPINVHDSWHGRNNGGKGDVFNAKPGSAIEKVLDASMPGSFVLVCGLATAKAVGVKKPELFMMKEWEDRRVAVIPHPSGINRFWNDAANVSRAKEFLSGVWQDIRG